MAVRRAVLGRAAQQTQNVGRALTSNVAQLSKLHSLAQVTFSYILLFYLIRRHSVSDTLGYRQQLERAA